MKPMPKIEIAPSRPWNRATRTNIPVINGSKTSGVSSA
jgi:hypothetical protein